MQPNLTETIIKQIFGTIIKTSVENNVIIRFQSNTTRTKANFSRLQYFNAIKVRHIKTADTCTDGLTNVGVYLDVVLTGQKK